MQINIIFLYINKKLISFFLAISFVIALIIFGNQFVLTVNESFSRGIPFQELLPIVFLNMVRDAPLIIALSLFLSIILTITQLYKDSEAVVMNSIGISNKDFILIVQPLVILVTLFLLILTNYVIPSAKFEKNIIENENSSEFSFITEGEFEEFKDGEIVFFASNSVSNDSENEQNMEEVFIYAYNNNEPVIVVASEGQKFLNSENNGTYLRLKDGVRYQGGINNEIEKILDFDLYDLEIVSGEAKKSIDLSQTIESEKTMALLEIGGNAALSEFQWRISQPFSVIVLSLIGVLLGKTSPRSGKRINLLIGVILFIVYNNGLLIIKSSIESNQINPIVGFFGLHLLVILFVLVLYQLYERKLNKFIDKIFFLFLKRGKHV
ncbi:MAG: LPS export ABC transporter permease LptF [Candidatus Pseudothioglobus sp.]